MRRTDRHSPYRSRHVVVHYQWHPLHGKRVPLLRTATRRDREEMIHIEARAGMSREMPAWMCDEAACAAMSRGEPLAEVAALIELREVLTARGIDSSSKVRADSSAKEEHAHDKEIEDLKATGVTVSDKTKQRRGKDRGPETRVDRGAGGPLARGPRIRDERRGRR